MSRMWLSLVVAVLFTSGICFSCSDDDTIPPADAAGEQLQIDLSSPDLVGSPDQSSPDLAAPDASVDTVSPDYGNIPNCPIEKDLTNDVPCRCYTAVATAAGLQACTATYKCCPSAQKPVCE